MFVTSVDWIRLPFGVFTAAQISVIAPDLVINIISSWKSVDIRDYYFLPFCMYFVTPSTE